MAQAKNQVSIDLEITDAKSYAERIRNRSMMRSLDAYISGTKTRNREVSEKGKNKFSKTKKEAKQDTQIPSTNQKPDIWCSRQSVKKKVSHETQKASRYKGMIEKYFNPGNKINKKQRKEKIMMGKPVEVNLFSDSREISESSVSQSRTQVKSGVNSDENSSEIKTSNTIDLSKKISHSEDLVHEKAIDKQNTLPNRKGLKFEENEPPNSNTAQIVSPMDFSKAASDINSQMDATKMTPLKIPISSTGNRTSRSGYRRHLNIYRNDLSPNTSKNKPSPFSKNLNDIKYIYNGKFYELINHSTQQLQEQYKNLNVNAIKEKLEQQRIVEERLRDNDK